MESNVLCSLLVLLFTVPREKTAVLCTLDYTDHTRCLPTRVHLESEGRSFTFIFVLNANSGVWCNMLLRTFVEGNGHCKAVTELQKGSLWNPRYSTISCKYIKSGSVQEPQEVSHKRFMKWQDCFSGWADFCCNATRYFCPFNRCRKSVYKHVMLLLKTPIKLKFGNVV